MGNGFVRDNSLSARFSGLYSVLSEFWGTAYRDGTGTAEVHRLCDGLKTVTCAGGWLDGFTYGIWHETARLGSTGPRRTVRVAEAVGGMYIGGRRGGAVRLTVAVTSDQ